MIELDDYLSEPQAAKYAGVVHETIKNWATCGTIETVTDRAVLEAFNRSKKGRPASRLYLREDLDRVVDSRETEPEPEDLDDWWSAREVAGEVGKDIRSVYRTVKMRKARTWKTTTGRMFIHPDDAAEVMDLLDPPPESDTE